MLKSVCKLYKKIIFIILSTFVIINTSAQSYYISNSQGSDLNSGLSVQSPLQSIDKLNKAVWSR